MKTLKKTLCLVLAVVMVLGLGVMSASAKLDNYSDKDAITYKEAVDVMTGIGVLEGDAKGFRPTDTVKRSEAAKIIAYLLIGNAAQADALKTNSDPFTDVPASHWAAGYIAYCAQRGIIAGMGDGTFAPDAQVTGLQFAKMLLSAIGYNANDEYSGSEWAINVSKDALTLKLFNGNLGGATNTAATREECALYAFNTLEKNKVTYSALLGGYIEADFGLNGATNEKKTIKADFKLEKAESDVDAFQRPAGHHWYVDKTTNIISATYGNPNDEFGDVEDLKASYTTGVKANEIFNLLGKTFIDGAKNKAADDKDVYGDFRVYVDGAAYNAAGAEEDTELNDLGNFTKGNTKTLDKTGNGVQTNVYAWTSKSGDQTVNHIVITVVNTYLAKVTDVKAGTATKDPVTKVELLDGWDPDLSTNGDVAPYTAITLDTKGFNTDEFEEDDYVFITAAEDSKGDYSIKSMVAPKTVQSTVSRYTKNSDTITITAAGEAYVAAKNVACDDDKIYAANNDNEVNRDLIDGEEHTLYVDEYGYLVGVGDVTADSDYVYVAQFGYKADTSSSFDKDNLAADIYYADGTHKIVTVNTKQGKNGKDMSKDGDANVFYDKGASEDDIADYNDDYTGVYELTMVKSKAVLTDLANERVDTDFDTTITASNPGTNVTKGVSRIDNYRADGKTVFYYVNGEYDDSDFSVTAYTGINTVPVSKPDGTKVSGTTFKRAEAMAVAAILGTGTDSNKIKAMLVDNSIEGESSDTVYFYTGISYDVMQNTDGTGSVTYVVYVDGEKQDLTLTYADIDTARDQNAAADAFKYDFFTVRDNKDHDFEHVTNRYKADGSKDDDATKKSSKYFQDNLLVQAGDNFDKTTILDTFSYTANSANFVDLRDVDEDDLITSLASLQRDFDKGEYDDVTFAIIFADNASNQISTIYLIDANLA